jgi:type IV secretory pathway TraG/TraD family ATPase VirD4
LIRSSPTARKIRASSIVDQAKSLAVANIQTEAEREKYWSQAAQALVKGLLMGQRIEAGAEASLSSLRKTLGLAPQDMTTRKYLSDLADERMTWIDKESKSSHVSGVNVSGGTSTAPTNVKEPLMYPYELGQMQQGQSVLFTARGHVLRSYFPDAAAKGFAGVADMMAEAARNIRP